MKTPCLFKYEFASVFVTDSGYTISFIGLMKFPRQKCILNGNVLLPSVFDQSPMKALYLADEE